MTHVFAPPSLLSRRRHHLGGGFLVHTLPPHTPPLPIFEQLFRASRGGGSTRRWFPTETKRTARETRDMSNPKRRRLGFSRTDRCFLDVYTETYMRKAFEFPVLAGVSSCPLRVHSPALTAFLQEKSRFEKYLSRWKLGSSDREVVVVVAAAQEKGGQRKGKLEKYFLSPSSPSSPPSPYLKSLTHRERGHFTSKLEGEEGDRAMGGTTSESHRCTKSIKSNHFPSFLPCIKLLQFCYSN